MRQSVFILAAVQIGLYSLIAFTRDMPDARTIDGGLAAASLALVGLVMAIFLIPAVILAITRRGLKPALVLCLIPPVLYLILIGPRGF